MSPARVAAIGIVLAATGTVWYGIWFRWASTRKWKPLDTLVTLSPGHIRSPVFEINVSSSYDIAFVCEQGFGHQPEPTDGPNYQYSLPDLGTSWSLVANGHVIATGTRGQRGDTLGQFEARPGRYVLEVDIARDGSSFDSRKPRLAIFENGGAQNAADDQGILSVAGFFLFTLLGSAAVAGSVVTYRNGKLSSFSAAWPLTHPLPDLPPTAGSAGSSPAIVRRPFEIEYCWGDRKISTKHPFATLSMTILVLVTILSFAFVSLVVGQGLGVTLYGPKGLPVHLLRTGVAAPVHPGIQPLVVKIEVVSRRERRVLVNYKPVAWQDLDAVLAKELQQRPPNWPVYFDGDPDIEWKEAAHAIDRIRGMRAEVILLGGRKERTRELAGAKRR